MEVFRFLIPDRVKWRRRALMDFYNFIKFNKLLKNKVIVIFLLLGIFLFLLKRPLPCIFQKACCLSIGPYFGL